MNNSSCPVFWGFLAGLIICSAASRVLFSSLLKDFNLVNMHFAPHLACVAFSSSLGGGGNRSESTALGRMVGSLKWQLVKQVKRWSIWTREFEDAAWGKSQWGTSIGSGPSHQWYPNCESWLTGELRKPIRGVLESQQSKTKPCHSIQCIKYSPNTEHRSMAQLIKVATSQKC